MKGGVHAYTTYLKLLNYLLFLLCLKLPLYNAQSSIKFYQWINFATKHLEKFMNIFVLFFKFKIGCSMES
jgi:hypothetical protein